MKLKFSLTYGTMWGESLHVQIEYLGYDGSVRRHNLPMNTNDGRLWTLETVALGSRHHPMSAFRYCYQVENAAGDIIRREWNMVPRIYPFDPTKDYTMPDSWRDIPFQYHMYTSAYAVRKCGLCQHLCIVVRYCSGCRLRSSNRVRNLPYAVVIRHWEVGTRPGI